MKNSNGPRSRYGLEDDVPVELGHLAVSFTLGIMTRGAGLDTWQAVTMPFANLTSTGQSAVLGIIQAGVPFVEMTVTQLIVNLRYCLTSCSLSQKLESGIPPFHRSLMAYDVTGEIFGVSVCKPGMLSPFYNYDLICVAVPGQALGALLRAIPGDLLPVRLLSAPNVTLYRMFLAMVIPPAENDRILTGVILASMAPSFLFTRVPASGHISLGFRITILAIMVASTAAIPFPVEEEPVSGS